MTPTCQTGETVPIPHKHAATRQSRASGPALPLFLTILATPTSLLHTTRNRKRATACARTLLPLRPDEHLAVLPRTGQRVHGQPKVGGPGHVPHPVCNKQDGGLWVAGGRTASAADDNATLHIQRATACVSHGSSCSKGRQAVRASTTLILTAGQRPVSPLDTPFQCAHAPACPVSGGPSCRHARACSLYAHIRTQLSQPAEARRRTGCPGAWLETRAPLGAAGDQETAVQPMGCAPSSCRGVRTRRQACKVCIGQLYKNRQANPGRGNRRAAA
jgi:hypothetical protein